MPGPLYLTDKTFKEEVTKAKKPVFIDFFAEWCGPCQMAAPIVDKLADDPEYKDKIVIAKLDVDANPQVASLFGIRSIPTMMVIVAESDDKIRVVASKIGFPGEDGIKALLDEGIEKAKGVLGENKEKSKSEGNKDK